MFTKWDTSGDGDLSMNEFARGVRKLGKISTEAVSDHEMMTLFRELDEDESMQVELEEFVTFISKTPIQHQTHRSVISPPPFFFFLLYMLTNNNVMYLHVFSFRLVTRLKNNVHSDMEEVFRRLDTDGSGAMDQGRNTLIVLTLPTQITLTTIF